VVGFKKERRKFVRLEAHHLVKYRVVDKQDAAKALSFVRNISAGGVLFYVQEKVAKGSLIELEINFPTYPHPIKAVAKVVRVNHLKNTGGYELGAEFVNIGKDEKEDIDKRVLLATKEAKEGVTMKKVLAVIALVLAVLAAVAGLLAHFGIMMPIMPKSWMDLAKMLALFSIAFSVLPSKE
jgi:hypothetical protein